MPKWNKDAKEFEVSVHYNNDKGSQIRIPKPILEKMDNPDKVTFVIDGKNIKIVSKDKSIQAQYSMNRKRGKMK